MSAVVCGERMSFINEGEALIRQGDTGLWFHFREPVDRFSCQRVEELLPLIESLDLRVQSEGLYGAGYLAYEAAPAFDPALKVSEERDGPVAEFALYRPPAILRSQDLLISGLSESEEIEWTPLITQKEYDSGFGRVKEYLRQGDSYQVNYTYRLESSLPTDPWSLFCRIQKAQNAGYAAFLDFPERTICSASPELFFSKTGSRICTRPMKGTAPRGVRDREDRDIAAGLLASGKDRAENMMIVDMIRNDLGRVALTGSVRVPELFTLEKYPTVWQMTSTVTAETEASVPELLKALFPCASITGAPKCRTMEIIRELENSPRGVYTGSVGYWGPGGEAQFNVAIRTVTLEKKSGKALYGTGGGVVWDSTPDGEFRETLDKTAVLLRKNPEFSLLETMLWKPGEGISLLEHHLDRLAASAEYFDRPSPPDRGRHVLDKYSLTLSTSSGGRACRVRLLLDETGRINVESSPLTPLPQPLTLGIAATPVDRNFPFLYHKTTFRRFYEEFKASCPGTDDVLLWNEEGELTESTIANLVLVLEGRHCTPPVECGLLGGTLRRALLERGDLEERKLFRKDLERAEEVYLINSVRGRMAVRLTP